MENAFTCNAFRVLSLSAETEMKDVYRQQQRLQNALELGDSEVLSCPKFLRPLPLGKESLLEAVHRLESQRLLEELFWVHDLNGKFDFASNNADLVLNALRSDANLNTTRGAVAQHNLAVISACLALECSTERAFDYWHEALSSWTKTLANRIFWDFMQDRAESVCTTSDEFNHTDVQRQVRQKIQKLVNDQLWKAVTERSPHAIAKFRQLAVNHAALLDGDSTITQIAKQLINDGATELESTAKRVAAIEKDSDPAENRVVLVSAEAEVTRIYEATKSILQALGATSCLAKWSDEKAEALGQLSVAYFNSLDDINESLRLVAEARQTAQSSGIQERLGQDWQFLQRALLCSEAMALISSGDFGLAEQKLIGAMTLSTDEQKQEVQELLEACHRARIFHGVDRTKKSPALRTVNGIGAAFYGKRDYDSRTKTYITNHWFVLLFIPIIPIGAYRVSDGHMPSSYLIHGRVPLSPLLKKWRWGVFAAIVLMIIYANVDFGTSSSPLSSSSLPESSPATSYSSTVPSSSETSPTYGQETPVSAQPGGQSSSASAEPVRQRAPVNTQPDYSHILEGQAIESERAELQQLSDSLEQRKKEIDQEEASLNSMESYMQPVRSEYTADNIPDDVRLQFNSTLNDYNSRVPEYNRSLESLKSDARAYQERVKAFNERVEQYNANR